MACRPFFVTYCISQSVDYAHQAMRSDKDKFESELVESQDEFASQPPSYPKHQTVNTEP